MIGIDGDKMAKIAKGDIIWCSRNRRPKNETRVIAIPSTKVLVRTLTLEVTKKKEIAKVLPFQIEPLLPLPLEQLSYDFVIRSIRDGKAYVTLFATPLPAATKNQLSCIADALAKVTPGKAAALHVGNETTCCLVDNHQVLAAHAFEGSDPQTISHTLRALCSKHKFPLDAIYVAGPIPECDLPFEPLGDYAIAIGLAKSHVDLRSRVPLPARQFRIYAAALIALSLTTFTLSELLLNRKHAAVQAEYASLEALAGKPHEPLDRVPASKILNKAKKIDRELQAVPANYPLVPHIPTVQEVIGWISSHSQSIKVEQFRYHMTRRPDKQHPKEHYRIRVELTFSAPTPTHARELHEMLTQPNDLVDGDVDWNARNEHYHASFFLQDRTQYL